MQPGPIHVTLSSTCMQFCGRHFICGAWLLSSTLIPTWCLAISVHPDCTHQPGLDIASSSYLKGKSDDEETCSPQRGHALQRWNKALILWQADKEGSFGCVFSRPRNFPWWSAFISPYCFLIFSESQLPSITLMSFIQKISTNFPF